MGRARAKRYCGSSCAHGVCTYGDALNLTAPLCGAADHVWAQCQYRHRGFGKPPTLTPVKEVSGGIILQEEKFNG